MATTQRIDEKTTSGGDYSEIVYLNGAGDVVDETLATNCIIRECTADGLLICGTFGLIS